MANNPLNESWFDVPNTLLGMGQNLLFHIMSIYFLHVWRDGHPEQGAVPFVFWPIAS